MLRRILLLAIFSSFVYASTLLSATPPMMNFQGILTNPMGNPLVSTSRTVHFTIYDAAAGGSIQWAETLTVNTDASGRFNVTLGQVHPLTDAVFSGTDRYLSLAVASDPELTPRTQIVSVGYTNRVSTVDGATGGTIGTSSTPGIVDLTNGGGGNGLNLIGDAFGQGGHVYSRDPGNFKQAALEPYAPSGGSVFVQTPVSLSYVWMNSNVGGTGQAELSGFGSGSVFSLRPGLSGNSAVSLTTNAISAPEILDEPGVAGNSFDGFAPGGAIAPMLSRTITCPAAGYVLAVASCEWDGFHTAGTLDFNTAGLSSSSSTIPGDQELTVYIHPGLPSGEYLEQLASVEIFPVPAGAFTVYYNCYNSSGTTGAFWDINLELLYVPTTYGTVSALAGSAGIPDGSGTPNQFNKQLVAAAQPDLESEKIQSMADNQARIEKELADMKAQLEELKKQLGQQGGPQLPNQENR